MNIKDDIKVTISSGGRSVETTAKKMQELAGMLKKMSPKEIRAWIEKTV